MKPITDYNIEMRLRNMQGQKTRTAGIIVGGIGLAAFFLPFFKITGQNQESFSGFNIMLSFFENYFELEKDNENITHMIVKEYDQEIYLWIWAAFLGGVLGLVSLSFDRDSLVSGIFNTIAAGALFFLKDTWETYETYGILATGAGWKIAFITFAGGAIFGYAFRCFEMTKAAEESEGTKKE